MARMSRVTTRPSSPSRAYRVRRVPVVRAGVFARSFPVSVLIGPVGGRGPPAWRPVDASPAAVRVRARCAEPIRGGSAPRSAVRRAARERARACARARRPRLGGDERRTGSRRLFPLSENGRTPACVNRGKRRGKIHGRQKNPVYDIIITRHFRSPLRESTVRVLGHSPSAPISAPPAPSWP